MEKNIKRNNKIICYEIMHGEKEVAEINTRGEAVILDDNFLPYDLYLENERKTQREAAVEAVRNIGLHQVKDIDESFLKMRWNHFFRGIGLTMI